MAIAVDNARCIGCGMCEFICPEEALKVPPSFLVEVAEDKCIDCLVCLNMCPNEALKEV